MLVMKKYLCITAKLQEKLEKCNVPKFGKIYSSWPTLLKKSNLHLKLSTKEN